MPCAATSCPRVPGLTLNDFHRQHVRTPTRVYLPTNKKELVFAIQEAERDNLTIRAIGTDMALSRAGVTDEAMILTSSLDKHVMRPSRGTVQGTFDATRLRGTPRNPAGLSAAVAPAITARPDQPYLVYVEGGAKVKQLLDDLSTGVIPALAVPAMGALSRQSIVGALATGTHGSENDRQPLADAIRAVHLVGPGGQEWWIERSNGWTDPATFAATMKAALPAGEWCDDIRIVRDDDLFYSAITGVGRLGVIYAVVLEVELEYWLLERRRPAGEAWPPIVASLLTSISTGYESPTGIFTTRGDAQGPINFLQIALNPNDASKCWIMERRRIPLAPGSERSVGGGGGTDLTAFCKPYKYADLIPHVDALVRPILTLIAASSGAVAGMVIPDPLVVSLTALGATIWVNNNLSWIETVVMTSANLGEMASRIAVAYPFLVPILVDLLVTEFQTLGDQRGQVSQLKRGPAAKVMDQTDYTQPTDCYFGIGSEYIFNARSRAWLDFVTGLFTTARNLGGIPGYTSLRFVPQTDAHIGMERWPLSVAVELGCLTPWPTATAYLMTAQAAAIAAGGIPHWGQWINEPMGSASLYRSALDVYHLAGAMVQEGHATKFATPFSASQALDPPSQPLSTIAATARPRVSVRALLAAGQTLVPSAPPPTSVRAVAVNYKPSLRMNATGAPLPAGRAAASYPGVRVRDLAHRLL